MSALRVTADRRFYLGRHRVHHATAGFALVAVGVWLVLSDWADRREWLPDLLCAAP